jgi:type III restriction enzyme
VIGKDIPDTGKKAVIVESQFEHVISSPGTTKEDGNVPSENRSLFEKPEEQEVAKATAQVIRQYERLRGSDQLQEDDIQQEMVKKVAELVRPVYGLTYEMLGEERVAEVVRETTILYQKMSIDIPKIVVVPKGEVVAGYEDFDLDTRHIYLQPVAQDILIQHLHGMQRYKLRDGSGIVQEKCPEDYLVRGLIDFNDISYGEPCYLALQARRAGRSTSAHLSEQ